MYYLLVKNTMQLHSQYNALVWQTLIKCTSEMEMKWCLFHGLLTMKKDRHGTAYQERAFLMLNLCLWRCLSNSTYNWKRSIIERNSINCSRRYILHSNGTIHGWSNILLHQTLDRHSVARFRIIVYKMKQRYSIEMLV